MKRVLMSFAAASAVAVLGGGAASAQSLGGFPIHEPGDGPSAGRAPVGVRSEVQVSQAPDAKVRSVSQALRLVKAGGTITVMGGVYDESLDIKKAVTIVGVPDAEGRNVKFRPVASSNCATVHPDTPLAPVSISNVVFEFDGSRGLDNCVNVQSGDFSLSGSYVVPVSANISAGGSFPQPWMPRIDQRIWDAHPDAPHHHRRHGGAGADSHLAHAGAEVDPQAGAGQSLGALFGGAPDPSGAAADLQHSIIGQGGPFNGPYAAIRVVGGRATLERDVIMGAQRGVSFARADEALMRGSLSNNIIFGNLIGVDIKGQRADILLNRNTISRNAQAGLAADVYYGLKIVGNEIASNGAGIMLSQNVNLAAITSNTIAQNDSDAIRMSSAFRGELAANRIMSNAGCTVQFFNVQQKILNRVEFKKAIAYEDFDPTPIYRGSNLAQDNEGDLSMKKLRKKLRIRSDDVQGYLPQCGDPL